MINIELSLHEMIKQARIVEKGYICNRELDRLSQYRNLDELIRSETPKNISYYAYWWGKNIGHRQIMIHYIDDAEYAFWWAQNIGDREIMRDRITTSEAAYLWATNIGDRHFMRTLITEPKWLDRWDRNVLKNNMKAIILDRITNKFCKILKRMELF